MNTSQRNAKIRAALAATAKKASASKKEARKLLISEGIYTSGGKLRAEYGGKISRRGGAST